MTSKQSDGLDALSLLLAVVLVAASFMGLFGCGGSDFRLAGALEDDTGAASETSDDAESDGRQEVIVDGRSETSDTQPIGDDADVGPDAGLDDGSDVAPDASSDVAPDTTPDTAPPDVDAAPTHKRIFTSSSMYAPVLSGLEGADAKCQALADAAKLGGVYRAWLSDSKTSAKARLTHATVPYVLVDGTEVASDWSDLVSGGLSHAINLTEKGTTPPDGMSGFGTHMVWTATEISGSFHDLSSTGAKTSTCVDWTSTTDPLGGPYASAQIGRWDSAGSAWTDYATSGCTFGSGPTVTKIALYCVEQ